MRKIRTINGPEALVNIYRNAELNEYVVKPAHARESAWYYTDDEQDALETAANMAGIEPVSAVTLH